MLPLLPDLSGTASGEVEANPCVLYSPYHG